MTAQDTQIPADIMQAADLAMVEVYDPKTEAWFDVRDVIAKAILAERLRHGGYQARVAEAHHALFHDDPTDIAERNARCFEEAIETAQAFGMTRDEAIALVDYTFNRPTGDPAKELGAKVLTAFSLGVVAGIDVMAAAEADLEKLQRPETIARIRAKRATRHGRGPLPGLDPNVRIVFGLEAQGHIPAVESALAEGADWQEIGRRIGWDGETAKTYYERHLAPKGGEA